MRISYDEMKSEFERVLISRGVDTKTAKTAASIIADNSRIYGKKY